MYLIAKSVSKWYPELFLIVSVIIYWALTAILVNPVAISLGSTIGSSASF